MIVDVRWKNPHSNTIAYVLFRKHFTEINDVYWANYTAQITIEKEAKVAIEKTGNVLDYFYISEKDERRIPKTYEEWKSQYRQFAAYTRLNTLMMLSSCFETYLRTVVGLALESKPAITLGCDSEIDGAFLLKTKTGYGDCKSNNYLFKNIVEEITKGNWDKRISAFKKYFKEFPPEIDTGLLEEIRKRRNEVGHFLGRDREMYEMPLIVEPIPLTGVSHSKLKEYLNVIDKAAKAIDKYLQINYIGSYDIIKYYYNQEANGELLNVHPGAQAKTLKKILGRVGLCKGSSTYYQDLLYYFSLDDKDKTCKYSKKSCVEKINKEITAKGLKLYTIEGREIPCSQAIFHVYCKKNNIYNNIEFCEKHSHGCETYFFSMKIIEKIVHEIEENQRGFLINLYEE